MQSKSALALESRFLVSSLIFGKIKELLMKRRNVLFLPMCRLSVTPTIYSFSLSPVLIILISGLPTSPYVIFQFILVVDK